MNPVEYKIMMHHNLLVGSVIIAITVVLHALALDLIIRNMKKIEQVALRGMRGHAWKPFALAAVVLAVFAAHVVQIWIWAAFYHAVGAFADFDTALYFSTTAFTTVGFGDVVPLADWRLLGAVEAANGFMLFGWSAAFTFEILSQLYRREGEQMRPRE